MLFTLWSPVPGGLHKQGLENLTNRKGGGCNKQREGPFISKENAHVYCEMAINRSIYW